MMTANKRNILLSVIAIILTIVFIAVTFDFRRQIGWWAFLDCFALFMTVFTWLMSLLIGKIIPHSGKILANIALVFGIIFVISLIAEYVVYTYV